MDDDLDLLPHRLLAGPDYGVLLGAVQAAGPTAAFAFRLPATVRMGRDVYVAFFTHGRFLDCFG